VRPFLQKADGWGGRKKAALGGYYLRQSRVSNRGGFKEAGRYWGEDREPFGSTNYCRKKRGGFEEERRGKGAVPLQRLSKR